LLARFLVAGGVIAGPFYLAVGLIQAVVRDGFEFGFSAHSAPACSLPRCSGQTRWTGFPPGTPLGPPASISTHGMVHFAAGGLGFVTLGVSCLLAARVMSRRNQRAVTWLSLVCGLLVLVGFFGGVAIPNSSPVLGIWIAVIAGWTWLSAVSVYFYRLGAGYREPRAEARARSRS
jgi:heme A synthase